MPTVPRASPRTVLTWSSPRPSSSFRYLHFVNPDHIDEVFNNDIPKPIYLSKKDSELKPNYFLAIPVTDSSVIKNYLEFRQYVLDTEPTLVKHCLSFQSDLLHITLLTLRLDNQFEIDQCMSTMKALQEELKYYCTYPEHLKLYFFGCETFYNKTLFINCRKHDRLEGLRKILIERFQSNNINLAGNYYEFIPHLSLIKMKQKLKTIPSAIYKKYQQSDFGVQNVEAIQLCQIAPADSQQRCTFTLDL
ncbi:unnamed protein product [Didymodactylos carnosus]|uniref:A-kinase anchor protein 7-like phosphoesterase domain-containing protein n=1 Tax=Didymodactylos carnosus TaxID=1234261 RepID=A0A815GG35_9BILA|nr:unnamed protein product [Didymodactylos carnosus]CAF4198794.1 unnamed protein product [Didymodactylos carnosus]